VKILNNVHEMKEELHQKVTQKEEYKKLIHLQIQASLS
jgi:hypothetical protein